MAHVVAFVLSSPQFFASALRLLLPSRYARHLPPGGRQERCVCVFTVAIQQRLKAMPLHVAGCSCSSLYKACAPGGGVRLKEVAATCLKCHFKNLSDFSGERGKQTKAVPPRGTKSHKSREKIHTKTM